MPNPQGAAECSLEIFGSWVTEMDPVNLPAGVSPDNQDGVFVPGSFRTRPALQRVFNSPFPAAGPNNFVPTITYAKSFVDPQGNIKNLYMDSNGILWIENLTVSPGTYTQLYASTPGSYCKSITAFGREYIAISDGLHGADVPLQYDGINLDRYTQDGPGAPPSVISIPLPQSSLANASSPSYAINSIQAQFPYVVGGITYYQVINILAFTNFNNLSVGEYVTISGNSIGAYNISGTIVQITTDGNGNIQSINLAYNQTTSGTGTGGNVTGPAAALIRANNYVTATTSTAHSLKVGYQVKISGTSAQTVGTSVTSIVINNEANPGLAIITTASAHGLIPGNSITITGVNASTIGGGISSIVRNGQQVTVVTNSNNNLSPGSTVTISGVTPTSFNGTWIVQFVTNSTTFTFYQQDTDATGSGGAIVLQWPVFATSTPQYYTVQESPTPTTFLVSISYSDGSWTGGTISFAWDGLFFVTSIPTSTSFIYQQYGPPGTYSASGGEIAAPFGQAAPGIHQLRISYLTRQGTVTRPSPPVTFVASGGQYLSIADMAIGPSNIVARILEFTGANGAFFFYLPVPSQVNGLVVSTATQINDNTTTSITLDFSDNSLFAGIGTSIPGNNTANQIIVDGALGFGLYGSRLFTYGQRNKVQNLLNMGFDGGYLPSNTSVPSGWSIFQLVEGFSVSLSSLGGVNNSPCLEFSSMNNSILSGNSATQSAYLDAYGAPIIKPNTLYKIRAWLKCVNPTDAFVTFSLSGTGFNITAIVPAPISATGKWYEATFSGNTPTTIPIDAILGITCGRAVGNVLGQNVFVDEVNLIYSLTPYTDNIANTSYVDNPEALDGVTGRMGPSQDTHKLLGFGIVRNTLYMLTQDPGGRLHETSDSGTTEPSGWIVGEVAANCGVLSAFGLCTSEADDKSASGGEEWLAWASESGARIFGGDQPWKISQEIQPNWFDSLSTSPQINMVAALTISAMNDPVDRVIYFCLPIIAFNAPIGSSTAPTLIYPMSYRELDTPAQIFGAPPFHPSLGGRLIATDNTRKWTRWNLTVNGMARLYRSAGNLTIVLFAGNGKAPGLLAGFGNVYTLNPTKYTDDDYGQINSYYVTAFLPTHEQEQSLQLDCGRKLLAYLSAFISTVGNVVISVYRENLSNLYPFSCTRNPGTNPAFDLEWGGANCESQRMAYKIASSPTSGTDNWFSITRFCPWYRKSKIMIRGSSS